MDKATKPVRFEFREIHDMFDKYCDIARNGFEATGIEIYTEAPEGTIFDKKLNKEVHSEVLLSDFLRLIMEKSPTLEEISIEGYDFYCFSKHAMVHNPPKYGLFLKFQEFVEDYRDSGETPEFCSHVKKFKFYKCALSEEDLELLGSSLFTNLESITMSNCYPVDPWIRHKYEEFLPGIIWDDDYYRECNTGVKNMDFYSDKVPREYHDYGYYSVGY